MAVHQIALDDDVGEIPRLNEWVEEVLAAEGVAAPIVFKMTLALEEAVVNVINHAFDGVAAPHRITLSLKVLPDQVRAELVDNGRGFDFAAAPAPDLTSPLDERPIGGLGLHLIRSMVDRVDYRRDGDENRLTIEKSLP
jgi:anti-sigma regulatory factor (Ser/Thr protein kinase)